MADDQVRAAAQLAETAVSALVAESKQHKRMARQHQDAAGDALGRAREIIENCKRLGINVEIVIPPPPVQSRKGREHREHSRIA